MSMNDRLFNTPFDLSLHIVMLLDTVNDGFTIDRITSYDFIAIYAQDFGFMGESLNGENGFAFSELAARRGIMKSALIDLVLDGLVYADDGKKGVAYTLSDKGRTLTESLHGKGYRSYLNIVMILMVRKYLANFAKFDPHTFIIDTPLHGFDDGVDAGNARKYEGWTVPLFHESSG